MATAAISKKSSKVPSWQTGVSAARKGWSTNVKTNISFDDVLSMFIASRVKEEAAKNTQRLYARNIGTIFFSWLKEERKHRFWQQVTPLDVQDFVIWLRSSHYAEASVCQILRTIRTMFHWMKNDPVAADLKLTHHLTALPKIPKAPGRMWIPTPSEVEEFLEAFDQDVIWGLRDFTIASLILDCGARIGELCNVEDKDVNMDMGLLRIAEVEGNKTGARLIPIDKEVTVPLLKRWIHARAPYEKPKAERKDPRDLLFITRNGGACTNNSIDAEFRKLRNRTKAGVGDAGEITPHVLRHYFCTYYLVNGGQLHNLQVITGHTELETLMIYVHMARELSSVREEHIKVSPLKNLGVNSGRSGVKKKRKMF